MRRVPRSLSPTRCLQAEAPGLAGRSSRSSGLREVPTMVNDNLSRRSFLAATGVLLGTRVRATPQASTPSLKDAYRNAFLIGAALDFRRPDEFNATEIELIKSQFNVLTP